MRTHMPLAPFAALVVAATAAFASTAIVQTATPSAAQPLATLRLASGGFIPPRPGVSADGRFIAFESAARLMDEDVSDARDIYVLDRASGTLSIESAPRVAHQLAGDSTSPQLSGDGRFIVFMTAANLTGEMPQGLHGCIVLRDRQRDTTECLSRGANGQPADGPSSDPVISGDGGTVAFTSRATNLLAAADRLAGAAEDRRSPATGRTNVYIWRRETGSLSRLPLDQLGDGVRAAYDPSLSADGETVAFGVVLDELEAPDRAAVRRGIARRRAERVYARHLPTGAVTRVGCDAARRCGPARDFRPVISGDGRFVAFTSSAADRVKGDGNDWTDVFLFDLHARTVQLVSRTPSGASGNDASGHAAISADGSLVAFASRASDLTCGHGRREPTEDQNLVSDVFLFDRQTQRVRRLSGADEPWWDASTRPAMDAAGRTVAFSSARATGSDDWRADFDLYLWSAGLSPAVSGRGTN